MRAAAFALIVLALAVPATASAAATVVGSGTTAWGAPFTLSVRDAEDQRCLGYDDDGSGGLECPLEVGRSGLGVSSSGDCASRHFALYGAIEARVARVLVRLEGGRMLKATRFEPVSGIDPGIAYWVATVRGLPRVRSVTAVAADGAVIARERSSGGRPCEEPHPFRGRRFRVGRTTDPFGTRWQLNAYRQRGADDDVPGKALCMGLLRRPPGHAHSEQASTVCGLRVLADDVKALEIDAADEGCGSRRMVSVFGLARARVGRIVLRSRAGWTVTAPVAAPRWLRAPARLWFATVRLPAGGVTVVAQDRNGRTLGTARIKPIRVPKRFVANGCVNGIFGGAI